MTVNKRFIIDVEETTQENALFENGKFVCFEDDTDEYLEKINELADENEQLKHRIKKLQNDLNNYSEIFNELNGLIDENEQLKQEIETLHEQLAHIGDVFE